MTTALMDRSSQPGPEPADPTTANQHLRKWRNQVGERSQHFQFPEDVRSRQGPRESADSDNGQIGTDPVSLLGWDSDEQGTADRFHEQEDQRRW